MNDNLSVEVFGSLVDSITGELPPPQSTESILDRKFIKAVQDKKKKDVNDYRNLGIAAIEEKKRLKTNERWMDAINEQNALYDSSGGIHGFDEGIKSVENWMCLQYMWESYFETFEALKFRGATYLWECYRHLKKGKSLETFTYPKKSSSRTREIENALDTLDDIGLSELAPAIVESVVGMVHDMYHQGAAELEGEDVPVYSTTAEAMTAQGILDKLNRRIEHIKNNSNWQEPYSQVTTLKELFNAFEVLADQVIGTHIKPEHQIKLSISIHKSGQKGKS